ncbi:MAG TPA: hypothetical protein ENN55_03970 [Firmicutes bacterium]|nr:hypothetical protein [Bacillota bacterium]
MNKKIAVFTTTLLLCFIVYFIFSTISDSTEYADMPPAKPAPGNIAPSFILGMKESKIYELSDFYGDFFIVLAFLDLKKNSIMTKQLLEKDFQDFSGKNPSIMWFNITQRSENVLIEELSSLAGLKHTAPSRDISAVYQFSRYPVFIVIDKKGIVRLIYDGFSPTLLNDIMYAVEG